MINIKRMLKAAIARLRGRITRVLGHERIGLVDVGSSGGLEPRWLSIAPSIKAFLFEPDERSRDNLGTSGCFEAVFTLGLSSRSAEGVLNLCRTPTVSSLLRPRYEFLSRFPNAERFDVVRKTPITLSTLDECLKGKVDECDFIKIDTQGTELDVLAGAETLLDAPIVGIEAEMEFTELYERQALFGEICSFLRDRGYEFYDFVNICRWERDTFSSFGQAVFGDGLFLRSPEVFGEKIGHFDKNVARAKARKYIAIVALYDHLDLLPICMSQFGAFLEVSDLELVKRLHKSLLRRRRIANLVLRTVNKMLAPLGIRVSAFQAA